MVMGNSLSLADSNSFLEHCEEIALDTAYHKPPKWLKYVDDTFTVWPHGPVRLQQFLHFNSVRPIIKFKMEVEANDTLQFLDILVMERGPKLATKVYKKPTHTGCYLHFKPNRPHHGKRGVIHSLISSVRVICHDQQQN
jgi:hypothetical protein